MCEGENNALNLCSVNVVFTLTEQLSQSPMKYDGQVAFMCDSIL